MTQPVLYSVHSNNPDLKVWQTTGVTTTTGALTVAIPADVFDVITGVQVTAVRNTTSPASACFATVRSYSVTSVVIQVFESKTTTANIGNSIEGLEATATATTVLVTVFGN